MGCCGIICSGLFLKENGERGLFYLFFKSGIDGPVSYSGFSSLWLPFLCVATEIEGTFRVNGSNKRMRELQTIFETPPRVRVPAFPPLIVTHLHPLPPFCRQYGKSLDWKKESYTTHDVASVFRRYLTQMPVRGPTRARAPCSFPHRHCR